MAGDASLERLLDSAGRLADSARAITRKHFRGPVAVEAKADASPVTIADRDAEAVIRTLIEKEFPSHGIVGEEFGTARDDAEYVWVIDPIDGTKAFITGKPLFGTLIAVERRGTPLLGLIDMPILDERWLGATGRPTTFNGKPAKARRCRALSDALLATTSPDLFAGAEAAAFGRVRTEASSCHYGGDCYNYALLASGFLDLVIEAGLKSYDFMALAPVITEAGGIITDWQGRSLGRSSDGRVIAAGDPSVHAAALARLSG